MSAPREIKRLLVANRSEIALRVLRTAREMGIHTVAVYSDVDRGALHVRRADSAVALGGSTPTESYLSIEKILAAAKETNCDAVHPGYGFLAENAEFADACNAAGLIFLGPKAQTIREMGDKVEARKIAEAAGVPLVPGLQEGVAESELVGKAEGIGFPVMLKAAAGGGGKGIRIVESKEGLAEAYRLASAEALSSFGDGRVYLEKFVTNPRHVEVQVVADTHGNVVAYGERECSVQRRHQKLVEESPSPALDETLRTRMQDAACTLSRKVGYVGAGTVEFLVSDGEFYFLEMNTRLQVEHPVTEERFGVDLVREQIRVGQGETLAPVAEPFGHAIEVRVNAEDPDSFLPSLGRIIRLATPGGPGVRMDSAIYRGLEITPHYDSMLAKLIVHAATRDEAIARANRACRELKTVGVTTSVPTALRVFASDAFRSGNYDTKILETIDRATPTAAVELASLAAAVARYLRTEDVAGSSGDGNSAGTVSVTPAWGMMARVGRLGRMTR